MKTSVVANPHSDAPCAEPINIAVETEPTLRDAELEGLLRRVYVGEGYTAPSEAQTMFSAAAIRARGDILTARRRDCGKLDGMIILVLPSSPGRRMAGSDEAELHLLAVAPELRGRGLGARLVGAALQMAKDAGMRRVLLWTQPTMHAAHRLYASCGFVRREEREPLLAQITGKVFWVLDRAL